MRFEDMLCALIARSPCTGYDLGRWLSTEGQFIRANADQSQIYKSLNRILKNELIEYTIENREGAPDAKVYSLTDKGYQHLVVLAESEYRPPARWQEADFSARYMCLCTFKPESLLPLIDTELAFRRSQIALYRNRERTARFDSSRIDFDIDVIREMATDLHEYNAASMDRWVAWLVSLRKKWGSRYPDAPTEGTATPPPERG